MKDSTKYVIPDDWDGETWCAWRICWPHSEKWEAILRGFLSSLFRGWEWDAGTGSLLDVIETGREIWAENYPMSKCGDDNLILIKLNASKIALELDLHFDGTIESIAPDAPDTYFDADSGDDTEAKILARRAALCNTVDRYCRTVFAQEAQALRDAGLLASTVISAILMFINPLAGVIAAGLAYADGEALAQAFESEEAIRQVICCFFSHLQGLEINESNFRSGPGECGFQFPDNSAQLAGYLGRCNQSRQNWQLFVRELGRAYNEMQYTEGAPTDCQCIGDCFGEDDWENDGRLGWFLDPTWPEGHWAAGVGWVSDPQPSGYHRVGVRRLCETATPLVQAQINLTWYGPDGTGNAIWFVIRDENGDTVYESAQAVNNGNQTKTFTFPQHTAYSVAWEFRGYTGNHNNQMDLHRSLLVAA